MAKSPFGPPSRWPDDDLIGVSHAIDELLTLSAYANGVFPMPTQHGLMGWYSPVWRAVLPLDRLRVTRSLRKVIGRYEIRIDTAFDAVLAGCADPRRPQRLDRRRHLRGYRRLHERGIVHTVEAWTRDNQLAGGLYGVSIGGLFAGESMFHRPDIGRDASKVALVALVRLLVAAGSRWSTARRAVADAASGVARGDRTATPGLSLPARRGTHAAGAHLVGHARIRSLAIMGACPRCPRWNRWPGS